jgi:hypothetical protein
MLHTFYVFGFRGGLMTYKPWKFCPFALRRYVRSFYAQAIVRGGWKRLLRAGG